MAIIPGWADLIVCGIDENKDGVLSPFPGEACGFPDLILLVKNLITDLVILSTFLAMAAFVYIGYLLLTSGGSVSKKEEGVRVFKKVIIGYLWILGAWLLVYTITSALLDPKFTFLLGAP